MPGRGRRGHSRVGQTEGGWTVGGARTRRLPLRHGCGLGLMVRRCLHRMHGSLGDIGDRSRRSRRIHSCILSGRPHCRRGGRRRMRGGRRRFALLRGIAQRQRAVGSIKRGRRGLEELTQAGEDSRWRDVRTSRRRSASTPPRRSHTPDQSRGPRSGRSPYPCCRLRHRARP